MREQLVIIGGSYGACEVAAAARTNGFEGAIRIFTEESELPYHRPPLSKAFLLGTADEGGLPLKGEKFYIDQDIDVVFDKHATTLDSRGGAVTFADGSMVKFDRLALAVGARARTLPVPGSDFTNVAYLRSIADARSLKRAAENADDIVVVGGGFIGLEVAAALAQRGKAVTVLESQEHLLNRVVARPVSDFLAGAHRARGVTIETGVHVAAFKGSNGRANQILAGDGRTFPAELIVIGIGSVPNIELAVAAGLRCGDGIVVDELAHTSHPRIVAAGDCTFYAGPHTNGAMRLESVQNASDQARCAGATIAGVEKPYRSVPWFWSDQFNFKLQIAGVCRGFDSYVERPGDDELSVFYFRDDNCVALDSINRARDHMSMRRLLQNGPIARSRLAAHDFDLAAVMAAEGQATLRRKLA